MPVSGRVFDADELLHLVDCALDFWLTTGRFAERVRARVRAGRSACATRCSSTPARRPTCSRSRALTSPKLGERRLQPGDEVITVAAGFPTTVNPIVQNGLVPVFVDVDAAAPTTSTSSQLEAAARPAHPGDHARAHAGQPVRPRRGARRSPTQHDLWLIEDCCDARRLDLSTGSTVGTFGDLATRQLLPRPPHHDGRRRLRAHRTGRSSRRSSSRSATGAATAGASPGEDNTCGKRFDWQLGDLPHGYDHKYTYSHIGYNLKVTDMQAAVGVAQLRQAAGVHRGAPAQLRSACTRGCADLRGRSSSCPRRRRAREPSWFGFPIAVRADAPVRPQGALHRDLEQRKIATRLLFGGNLIAPARLLATSAHRIAGRSTNTDFVMTNTLLDRRLPGPDDADARLRHRRAARGGLLGARARYRSLRARRLVRRPPAAARRPRGHCRRPRVVQPLAPGRRRRPGRAAAVQPRDRSRHGRTRSGTRGPTSSSTPRGPASSHTTATTRDTSRANVGGTLELVRQAGEAGVRSFVGLAPRRSTAPTTSRCARI